MNNVFLGEPSEYIRNWFVKTFISEDAYTILTLNNGSTRKIFINGPATWKNIGVKSDQYSYDNTLKSCQLGNKVTEISGFAFVNCFSLTSIDIPNSVTSIGRDAFSECHSLTSITFKSTIETLEQGALSGNVNLLSVIGPLFPSKGLRVNNIESGVFRNCESLKQIYIDLDYLSSIGYDAFGGCSSLTSIFFVSGQGATLAKISAMANYPFGADPSIIKMARGEQT